MDFPYVGQAFVIEKDAINKKTGKVSRELACGITSQTCLDANPEKVLGANRDRWCIENRCHYILDWTYDEDRCRIRTQYGPENVSRLRRFAISGVTSNGVTETTRKLAVNVRLAFDYLRMTENWLGRDCGT